MGSSAYHQNKHKRIIGPVEAVRASKCFNCSGIAPLAAMYKGWCASCISGWGQTADPNLIASAQSAYAAQRAAEPPTAKAYERLKNRIADRRPDEWFIPMLLYIGGVQLGQVQANWNFLQAMYELEVRTPSQAHKIGKESADLLHLCGRHAPMQNSSLGSFIGRVMHSPEVWRDVDKHMKDYIQTFVSEAPFGFRVYTMPRTRIDRYTTHRPDKCKRAWRIEPSWKPRRQIKAEHAEWKAKYGPVNQKVTTFWPFAVKRAPEEQDMLMAIDRVTKHVPEQWRQDLCQDLVVAVLSGEVTLDNLRDALPKYVKEVFQLHPIKYGSASLDEPLWWSESGGRTLGDTVRSIEQDDREEQPATCSHHDWFGWHEGFDRPVGAATLADVAREKNNGRFIE